MNEAESKHLIKLLKASACEDFSTGAIANFTTMRATRGGYTYFMTNKYRTVLYTGATSDLYGRVAKHKEHYYSGGFSDKYNAVCLVYYEVYDRIEEAIAREKQLKGWSRKKKEALINAVNPEWKDLFDSLDPEAPPLPLSN